MSEQWTDTEKDFERLLEEHKQLLEEQRVEEEEEKVKATRKPKSESARRKSSESLSGSLMITPLMIKWAEEQGYNGLIEEVRKLVAEWQEHRSKRTKYDQMTKERLEQLLERTRKQQEALAAAIANRE